MCLGAIPRLDADPMAPGSKLPGCRCTAYGLRMGKEALRREHFIR